MQFTLFSPPRQSSTTVRISAPAPEARPPEPSSGVNLFGLIGWCRENRLMLSIVASVLLLGGALLFGWGTQSLQGRFDRIEVGMSEEQVRNILSPPNRGRKWRTPDWVNKPVLSTEGYAVLHHSEAGATVTVEFMDGRVTRKALEGAETASR
jgi:hypothetical protein